MDTSVLRLRIRRGRAWLSVHTIDHCQKTGKAYDHEEFEKNLATYEACVDELVANGGSEIDCFSYTGDESLENGGLTEYEMEFLVSYPELNQESHEKR